MHTAVLLTICIIPPLRLTYPAEFYILLKYIGRIVRKMRIAADKQLLRLQDMLLLTETELKLRRDRLLRRCLLGDLIWQSIVQSAEGHFLRAWRCAQSATLRAAAIRALLSLRK